MFNPYEEQLYRTINISVKNPKMGRYALDVIAGKDGEKVPDDLWHEYQFVLASVMAINAKAEIAKM